MSKKTTLNDSASIYQKREKQTEKQKLKDLHGKEKLIYFKDYYFKIAVVALIALFFIGSLLYTVFKPKPKNVLNVAIVNNSLDEEKKTQFITDLTKYLNVNTKKQKISIDDSFLINQKNMDQFSMSMQQKITTLMYSSEVDAIVCDKTNFNHYYKNGYLDNLSDQIPTDLYSKISNSIYSIDSKAIGIQLSKCKRYQKLGLAKNDDQILGILVNSKNKNNVVKLIKYLFEE
ncbi:hypothetical protein lbkm_2994 [Lachnospiraceae bacterium KM106-2]|nr:hypothetical protein lbkm_2994 [Lachnospiraceae bacterium KM106-2]